MPTARLGRPSRRRPWTISTRSSPRIIGIVADRAHGRLRRARSSLVIVLVRRTSRLERRLAGLTRGGRRQEPRGDPRRAPRQGLRGLPRGGRAGGPDRRPRGDPAAGVPADRARPLQPVRGHGRQPELRARDARPAGRRVRRQQPPLARRARACTGRRSPGARPRRRSRRRRARPSGSRWPRERDRPGARDGDARRDTRAGTGARHRRVVAPDRSRSPTSTASPGPSRRPFDELLRVSRRARAASRRRSSRSPSGARTRRSRTPRPTSPTGLDALLAGLNAEQRRAVTHARRPAARRGRARAPARRRSSPAGSPG